MNFKAYDILASLIPGFLLLLVLSNALGIPFDKDLLTVHLAVGFLLGYLINTLGSWLEGFYFFTWCGKPSDNLLKGVDIWKVKFYHSAQVKELLRQELNRPEKSDDELFSIAMRSASSSKESRVEDFNALYAFSRSLLTTVLLASIISIGRHYSDWRYYAVLIPMLIVTWLRSKQRGYYWAREVLDEYLKTKRKDTAQ